MTEVDGDTLVYDQMTHHIHHLNATTHAVWSLCDGTRTLAVIAQAAGVVLGAEVSEDVVRLALSQLTAATLLAESLPTEMRPSRSSRRFMLRRLAIAGGVALPALVSVSAPTAAGTISTSCAGFHQGCNPHNLQPCCGSNVCIDMCGTGEYTCREAPSNPPEIPNCP
jgi:hypothetical protein